MVSFNDRDLFYRKIITMYTDMVTLRETNFESWSEKDVSVESDRSMSASTSELSEELELLPSDPVDVLEAVDSLPLTFGFASIPVVL